MIKKSAQCPPTKKINQQATKQKYSQSFHLCVNGERSSVCSNQLKKDFYTRSKKTQQNNF